MKTKISLWAILLIFILTKNVAAQAVITQPNGNVIPNPNLSAVNKGIKVNLALLKNVSALKLSGKTTSEIVKALKLDKINAKDAFKTVKETRTPDAENIAALCFAGYTLSEIVDALLADGYTATVAVGLLKNAENCTFSRPQLLRLMMSKYALRFSSLVPIIQSNYSRDPKEVEKFRIEQNEPVRDLLGNHKLKENSFTVPSKPIQSKSDIVQQIGSDYNPGTRLYHDDEIGLLNRIFIEEQGDLNNAHYLIDKKFPVNSLNLALGQTYVMICPGIHRGKIQGVTCEEASPELRAPLLDSITKYFNSKIQPDDRGRGVICRDVFEDLKESDIDINKEEDFQLKVLVPYNIGDYHWTIAEIIIKKQNKENFDLNIY
ncbi:MAG: hypothetical protein EOP34_10100, partial [Rickettsiales bacterium]